MFPARSTTQGNRRTRSILGALLALLAACLPATRAGAAEHVIHVSIDGLRADAIGRLGPAHCPHLHRLVVEGAFTGNARTDVDITVTLPNHVTEVTGRGVLGPAGHGVDINYDDGRTIEEIHGSYVAGVFDVVHDRGLTTSMFAGKSKFALIDRSWNALNGALDATGPDDGRDKIDTTLVLGDTNALVAAFLADMSAAPRAYSFVHLRDPDSEGHASGWASIEYFRAVMRMDSLLGEILSLADDHPALAGRTAIVVTADHGGVGYDHGDATDPLNYTVPFAAWGPGVTAGADLYALNAGTRADPGTARPSYDAAPQPIRNGETANLSLDLLGLPGVPGSTIDAAQDLVVGPPAATALPAVSIVTPADGAVFLPAPESIVVEASADCPAGILRVEFFVDWAPVAVDETAPFEFEWTPVPLGDYTIAARAVGCDGWAAVARSRVEVRSASATESMDTRLAGPVRAEPNPFGSTTRLSFSLDRPAPVEMSVYDVLGRRVALLLGGGLPAGRHAVEFDASRLEAGVYFYRLRAGVRVETGKLLRIR